jgi:hypothetical protein
LYVARFAAQGVFAKSASVGFAGRRFRRWRYLVVDDSLKSKSMILSWRERLAISVSLLIGAFTLIGIGMVLFWIYRLVA